MKTMTLLAVSALSTAMIAANVAAAGGSVTGTMPVTATAIDSCSIGTPTTMAFGLVNPIAPSSNADTTATAAVTCTNTTPYLVAVAGGALGAGGFTYSVYSDSGRTTLFPVSGGAKTLTGTGSAQTVTMYGRIALPQGSVVPGSYSTTTAVLVEW